MKNTSNYQVAKNTLKAVSLDAKKECITDKPMIRQIINDTAYELGRDLNLSEHEKNLLSDYSCYLHPKN